MKTRFACLDLAVEFHRGVSKLRLSLHLRDQMSRSAASIALNLAEGSSRPSSKERTRFFRIALGSARECQVILKLAENTDDNLIDLADHLGASIYKLILSVEGKDSDHPKT